MREGSVNALRVLRLLASGPARCAPWDGDADRRLRLESGRIGTISVERATFEALRRDGHVALEGATARLTPSGRRRYRALRQAMPAPPSRAEDVAVMETQTPDGRRCVAVNLSESPLAQLASRRSRNGSAFLSQAEFDAGERLRGDYTRAMIMPRISANWETPIVSGRRGGVPGDRAALTDAVLAARHRVEAALVATGPELSGVLVDVCCFLKGLETVEAERGWPARSAKVVLKTALAALARHYAPPTPRAREALHWGAEDYRPSISG